MAKRISDLSAIASDYRAILCDVWGVLHNGQSVYRQAERALMKYREQGGQVVLLTRRRKTKLGRLYGKTLMLGTRIVSDYFAVGDTPQFDSINFDFITPIKEDKTLLQFINHVESMPVAEWGFSKPNQIDAIDLDKLPAGTSGSTSNVHEISRGESACTAV